MCEARGASRKRLREKMRTLLNWNVRKSLGKVEPDLRLLDLRIVNGDACSLRKEIANERNGGRFARVAGVSFERKPEDGNVLSKSSWSMVGRLL